MGLPCRLTPVGSLRRFAPVVGEVCLLAAAPPDRQSDLVEVFSRLPLVASVIGWNGSAVSVATARGEATLYLTTPDQAGSAMVWHTGSSGHAGKLQERARHRGFTFQDGALADSRGAAIAAATEDEVYRLLDLPYIPPELREDAGEVEAAERGELPRLVSDLNIRGDLHMHSTWSDGRDSIADMVRAATQLGYEYVAMTDHSERAMSSRSLAARDAGRQANEIDAVRQQIPGIDVLWGTEVEILRDGSLDFDDDLLSRFDIVLASLHDHGGHDPQQLLDRYLGAMANPFVNVITHPANRSPGYSEGYALDFDRLFAAAVATGTALEIDGAPGHLDMDGELARRAVGAGVTVVIDSDCHRMDALARQMRFGIGTARRGWVEPRHVLNAGDVNAVRDFVARKRAGR
jgi:DNA polymerase (family 10)